MCSVLYSESLSCVLCSALFKHCLNCCLFIFIYGATGSLKGGNRRQWYWHPREVTSIRIQSICYKQRKWKVSLIFFEFVTRGRVFFPFKFFSNDNSGIGLGLSICSKLTSLFKQGRLHISSMVDEGTIVTFRAQFRAKDQVCSLFCLPQRLTCSR